MNLKQDLQDSLEKMSEEKRKVASLLVDDLIFQFQLLKDLRGEAMIKRHPRNPSLIKPSPAYKMYRETSNLFTLNLKTFISMSSKNETKEKSPLRMYLEGLNKW